MNDRNRQPSIRMVAGCGDQFISWLVTALNYIETCVGVILLTYGFLISLSHKSGNCGLQIYCIGLGLGLLFSASFCAAGLQIPLLERYLLALGGISALLISIVEFFSAFRIEFNKTNWTAYLREYASELYLNEIIIGILDRKTNWLFCIAIFFALLELLKCYIIYKVRKDLIDFENIRANQLNQPLLWQETAREEFCDSSVEFLPSDQDIWDDDDPLFWAKPAMVHQAPDLSWAEGEVL